MEIINKIKENMDNNIEIWKDIPGYENMYQASSIGRIKSLAKIDASGHRRKEKIIKPGIDSDGYYNLHFCRNSIKKNIKAHRAIAFAFIPNPQNKPQINHKNFNKLDNRIENLEWVDCKTNIQYTHKMGMANSAKGEQCRHAKLNVNQVKEIRLLYKINKLSFKKLAEMFKVNKQNIRFIINKETWKHVN